MAAIESQVAVPRPKLRWYQFSLRGLLLFTLFVAVLLSILAVGRTSRVYEASWSPMVPAIPHFGKSLCWQSCSLGMRKKRW